MTREELQQKIDEAKQNIELWTKELEKPESKRWRPEAGETFYACCVDGTLWSYKWEKNDWCERAYSINNVFKTKEDAKEESDRRLAEVELLDMCDGAQSKLYEIKKMWHLQYNLMRDFVEIMWGDATLSNPYIFATKESAENAIDTLGVEKLKLIFRVA